MSILMGPTGKLIRGNVLDVNQKYFDRALRFYDRQLYSKWNPEKLKGNGCWEIRRKPEFNSCLDIAEFNGSLIFKVGPKEIDLVHHVLDCAYLNYDAIRKLKEMDTWQYGNSTQWQDEVERRTKSKKDLEKENRLKEKRYMVEHFRAEIKAFKEMVRDGKNPHAIAGYWDRVKAAD